MINAISVTQPQYYKTMTKQNKEISEKNNNQYNKSDVYIPTESKTKSQEVENSENSEIEKTEEKELFYGLDNEEWKEFAKKYDVENLSREEKNKLLTELKEKGVLNEEEYKTTKFVFIPLKDGFKEGGEITIGESEKLKLEEKNWLKNYDTLANYCDSLLDMLEEDSSNRENIQNIRDIYLKIADIFDKISEERKNL